jgi:hypothetical protein
MTGYGEFFACAVELQVIPRRITPRGNHETMILLFHIDSPSETFWSVLLNTDPTQHTMRCKSSSSQLRAK